MKAVAVRMEPIQISAIWRKRACKIWTGRVLGQKGLRSPGMLASATWSRVRHSELEDRAPEGTWIA